MVVRRLAVLAAALLLCAVPGGAGAQAAPPPRFAPGAPVRLWSPEHAGLFAGPAGVQTLAPPSCGTQRVIAITAGTLGGAAAGWLVYELAFGVWGRGGQDRTARRLRWELVSLGAVVGLVQSLARPPAAPGCEGA